MQQMTQGACPGMGGCRAWALVSLGPAGMVVAMRGWETARSAGLPLDGPGRAQFPQASTARLSRAKKRQKDSARL